MQQNNEVLCGLMSTISYGLGIWEQIEGGSFALIFLNEPGKDILSGLVPENTFPSNPQIEKMFLSGLERQGEEVRVDVVGLAEKPFLARIFALSRTHICVHMHNPNYPFVVVNRNDKNQPLAGQQDSGMAPPLLAVEDAASIVSGYAEPGRKRMRSGAPEEQPKVIYSSMDYLVGGSNVNLPKVRTASLYDDLAVPVLQWDRQGKCLTANWPMLNLLELPDATTVDIDSCFEPESAEAVRKAITEIEKGRTMSFTIKTQKGQSLTLNLSCSNATSLLIAVMIAQNVEKEEMGRGSLTL